ncbi:MAG: rod shape-determining protein MreC [Clostridiales bacterium]|nr:rod shape-determining protein MreC [Clostridiales bacterium]
MKKRKNNLLRIISYILIIIVLIITIIITNKPRESTVVETVLSYTVMPIQRGFNYFTNWIMGYRDIFPQINDLTAKNELLNNENIELKKKLTDYEIIKNENVMLKEQMNLKEKYPEYTTVSAEIIAQDTSSWYEALVINQGSDNGIKEGMTVIADKGLVGYIKEVTPNTAKVLCITDPGNSVSSRISKTREAVIARGELGLKDNSQMKLKYVPTGVELTVGDIIETSGLGGIYKKGIKVGEVEQVVVEQNSLETYAIIRTAVDFDTLEYVIVIIDGE